MRLRFTDAVNEVCYWLRLYGTTITPWIGVAEYFKGFGYKVERDANTNCWRIWNVSH